MGRPEDGEPSGRLLGLRPEEGTKDDKPETTGREPGANHSGNGRSAKHDPDSEVAGDSLVDPNKVMARFRDATRARLKDGTRAEYEGIWRQFCRTTHPERYTKRQLVGGVGRRLILEFLETKNKPSWRITNAALKAVWMDGLGIPYPISKRDLPKLPPVGRRHSPRTDRVKPWVEAFEKQPDSYMRVLWLLFAQLGLRPSHVGNLVWSDVVWDERGEPYAIVASGVNGRFKTHADVKAWLPRDLSEALAMWSKVTPFQGADKPILPWRDSRGNFRDNQRMSEEQIARLWERFRAEWSLPALNRVELRHFVKSVGHKAGMDEVALCYLQGHKPEGMGGHYDNPEDNEDIFDRQRSALPAGPLGSLKPPVVELAPGIDREVLDLVATYMRGGMVTSDLANRMEALRLKALAAPAGSPFAL